MSEEKPTRATSDIIADIELDVKNLIKIVATFDMNAKITLDRVNKIYAYIDKLQKEEEQFHKEHSANSTSDTIKTSTENMLTVADPTSQPRRAARAETIAPAQTPPPVVQQSSSEDKERKIPITQRIVDNNTKDIFMADVIVMAENKDIVHRTKTNAAGKWQAYLKPGSYTVNITKTDTATKKRMEVVQNISVPNSDKTVILPNATMNRN